MHYGWKGRILRVNLSSCRFHVEKPGEDFYRLFMGGSAVSAYYLLKEIQPGAEALSPDNVLVFATGPVTGVPVGGCNRMLVGAKSPLTGAFGDAAMGGFFGPELKRAGYDAVVINGKADKPVYLWMTDGRFEIRDARGLWGKPTAEAQGLIREELGDAHIRVAGIGPAGEKLVRFACIISDANHAAARCGLGAVMGSKNLKAIACRGHDPCQVTDDKATKALSKWLSANVMSLHRDLYDQGTPGNLFRLNRAGALVTRNFSQGVFPEAIGKLDGRTYRDTILTARRGCWACPIRCKREVTVDAPYEVSPVYGGPEFATIAALGSNCGINNLAAIVKANQLCNAYGLDTISTGVVVAFAMECFERRILDKDVGGLPDLSFGNAEAMLRLVEAIGRREGIGDRLAEGVARAAQAIGGGAAEYAMHVKGQELSVAEPRCKQGLALGYAISPTGPDHCQNVHDDLYTAAGPQLAELQSFGISKPLALNDLSAEKVRLLICKLNWEYLLNCLGVCSFVFGPDKIEELVRSVTGWDMTANDMLKVGERCVNMARMFNLRQGLTAKDDDLPRRVFRPHTIGPLSGVAIDEVKLQGAKRIYYRKMGWDETIGIPSKSKLGELGIAELAAEGGPR